MCQYFPGIHHQFVLIFLSNKITHFPKIQPDQGKRLNTQTRENRLKILTCTENLPDSILCQSTNYSY